MTAVFRGRAVRCGALIKRGSRRDRCVFWAASGALEARASVFVHAVILLHLLRLLVLRCIVGALALQGACFRLACVVAQLFGLT